jgi:hypothetical protein
MEFCNLYSNLLNNISKYFYGKKMIPRPLREGPPQGTLTSHKGRRGKKKFPLFYCFKWKVLLDYIQIQNIKSLGFTYEKRESKQVLGGIFCC